ncbi:MULTISPECIES: hypothetical protein [Streptosporangium]|uniref:DUF8094 domain-containing protein n=1 Tax=Streptosporangium brasiliense TaxID=47480 RepID=A0ABT9R0G8_9ACTN|nr:hypothetical protein [Streptosporangium brasiliense]MDP9862706.1 hypothetical protein [Streptosporangium brasiliense]
MRERGRRDLLVLALSLVTATAACSGSGGAAPGQSPRGTGVTSAPAALPAPRVTLAEAEKALAGILGAEGVLSRATPRQEADARNMAEQTRDGQEALALAALNSSRGAPPHYTWGRPQLLVPRVQRSPFWFAAIVSRVDAAGSTRPAVLTLIKYGGERWYLSSASLLEPGVRAPEIAKDAEGYATALGYEDTSVEISPRLMAPLHATSAEEGTAGFTAGLIEQGPHTTGYADEISTKRLDYKKDDCLGYDSIFAASNYPVHALRTADGGAMVTYSLIRTTTLTSKVEPCAEIVVPPSARGLISERRASKELRTVETQQYVSTVPAKNSGRPAKIIGYLGGITKAFVS